MIFPSTSILKRRKMRLKPANVYWITGMSGAGKTTIGKIFYEHLRSSSSAIIFLDGDVLREIFSNGQKYDKESRKELAKSYARICKMISDQGVDVICSTVSMFHEVQAWNRKHINNYCEIYVKVPLEVLHERDQKGIYSNARNNDGKNIVGIDLLAEEPLNPEIVLCNDGSKTPNEMANILIEELLQLKSDHS